MKLHHYFLSFMLLLSLGAATAHGQTGKSLVLNGTDQYMRITNHVDFNISKTESFTVCCWMKVNRYIALATAQRFLAKRDIDNGESTGENASGYELFGAVSSSQFFANNAPGPGAMKHNNSMSVFASTPGSLDTWIHIALVVDRNDGPNGKMYLYQNGQRVGTSAAKDVSKWYVNNVQDVLVGIGLKKGTPSYPLKGEIDDLHFYKKALTEAEMVAELTGKVGPTTQGLVAAYDFETVSGLTVPDISGHGHAGTLFNYPVEGDCTIASATLTQDTNFTGRGNQDEPILKANLIMAGTNPVNIQSIKIKMDGTTAISDVTKIKIYSTGNSGVFDSRKVSTYTKLGECIPATGEIICPLTGLLASGANYLWLTYDIADNAKEGNKVDASILSITTATETHNLTTTSANGTREILLTRKLLFAPGDDGSKNYRIPAIITAHDGSLVTATDRRKANQTDLPEDIDVVIRRSTDNGKTWSSPLTIAKGTGRYNGFGDAALIRTQEEGGVICLFVGGPGFFESTPNTPIRTYMCKSSDNGVTWTAPKDITNQLFGSGCSNVDRKKWYGSFCTSGAGLLGSDGTIYVVAAVRETSSTNVNSIGNYVYFSKDNGETWDVSGCVKPDSGNEAKIIELNDKTLLVSIRNQSKGARYYSTSKDGGKTWSGIGKWNDMIEPGCDGDIIYYTSTKDGYEKNRILHSVPNNPNSRVNVSIFLSYDEGKNWPINKSICPTGSGYSSLCILPDGTIGAYTEENYTSEDLSTYFINVSLDWLTDGLDSYHAPGTIETVGMPVFSVQGGSFEEAQTIELTSETENAKIYYTLDGSLPSADATLYTQPIAISTTTTIKSIALKDGMSASAIATATYIFSPSGKYCLPTTSGSANSVINAYLEKITTTGGDANLDYSGSKFQAYTKIPGKISIKQGESFTLNLKAKNLGNYSTSVVRQDLRYNVAVMYTDWNVDYDFSLDEGARIAGKINTDAGFHITGGNIDVLNISKIIQVPAETPVGLVRCRVYYTNAWSSSTAVLSKACGPVAEGPTYDFDIEVTKKATGINTPGVDDNIRIYTDGNTIIVEGAEIGSILKVYTITGQALYESVITRSTTVLPEVLSASNIYILKIINGSSSVVRKIVK